MQWYRDTFTSFTPSASIAYRWTDDAMTYVSYAEGFKGGGWNSHFNDPPLSAAEQAALHEFRPGRGRRPSRSASKLDLADDTLRLNVRGVHLRLHGHAGDLSRAFRRRRP